MPTPGGSQLPHSTGKDHAGVPLWSGSALLCGLCSVPTGEEGYLGLLFSSVKWEGQESVSGSRPEAVALSDDLPLKRGSHQGISVVQTPESKSEMWVAEAPMN